MIRDESLSTFMKCLKKEMKLVEAKLQIEENGSKIAFLQGECSGYNALCATLEDANYDSFKQENETMDHIFTCDKENEWGVRTSDFSVLMRWHNFAMDVEEVIAEAKKPFEKRVNKKKDQLFYDAEKGRDLHFCKGWYFIMSILENWCVAINKAYDNAVKQRKKELPFEDDFEISEGGE